VCVLMLAVCQSECILPGVQAAGSSVTERREHVNLVV